MSEQRIDVSDLPAPEPMEQILDALADLADGDWLLVTHRRAPHPLYGMISNMGYHWHTRSLAPDHFEILIWPASLGSVPPGC